MTQHIAEYIRLRTDNGRTLLEQMRKLGASPDALARCSRALAPKEQGGSGPDNT